MRLWPAGFEPSAHTVEIYLYDRGGDEVTGVHGFLHVRLYPIGFEPLANTVEIYVCECKGDEVGPDLETCLILPKAIHKSIKRFAQQQNVGQA